jgi:hypothetical protein
MQIDENENVEPLVKDKKQHKRLDGTVTQANSNGSAASLEDDRRAQWIV